MFGHGICGPNSMCCHVPSSSGSDRKCSCIPEFKMKNDADWSWGCEPEFNISCKKSETTFRQLNHIELYGYDNGFLPNYTLEMFKNFCWQSCDCKGFQVKFANNNFPAIFLFVSLRQLLNGRRFRISKDYVYLKEPKTILASSVVKNEESELDCSNESVRLLDMTYAKTRNNEPLDFVLWFSSAIGVIEFVGIFLAWCFLLRTQQISDGEKQGYPIATGFRNSAYAELKKATQGFSEETGRGAGGTVDKGMLPDQRVAAVKRLNVADQGEAGF